MSISEGRIRVALDGHVVGRRKGGNESYVLALAEGLAARDDIDLLVYTDRGARWPGERPVGLRLRRLLVRQPQVRIPFELPLRVTRDRADLLHVQYVAPPVARTPIVTAVHDLSFEDAPHHLPPAMRLRLRALVRLSVRRSAVVVTPSHFSRERLLCHLDVDPGNVFVTPPAVRLSPASAVPDRDSARLHHLGLPAQFVLFVGRVEPRKNVARLIAAVAAGRMGGAELGLVLAGSSGGRPTPDVEAAISSWSAGSWVRRLGYVSDDTLALLYRSARVVAYPSLYEGFGLPVLEAMAAGVPVVASAISAIPEVAGDAALLVDPEDVHALGEALLEAACDERTRARLATAGPARAAGFTAASFAASTMAAYRHALGG